jgi:dTDP-4-dehydrorhamnose reductase
MTRILLLGVNGMLGNAMFRFLSSHSDVIVFGTSRDNNFKNYFSEHFSDNIISDVNAENYDSLIRVFAEVQPNVVINCIGLVKQLAVVNDPLRTIPINTLLPHRLAALCQTTGSRLIHFSTDCVFSGAKGNYSESDLPDAIDLYGRSKLLGEVGYPHTITLRTSMIGHELSGHRSLLGWFLNQQGSVNGYTHAIFSGFPTVELANIVYKYVLQNKTLHGVYHVASSPINKFDLLNLISKVYKKKIEILPSDELSIDRSLNAERFNRETGYNSPEWDSLVQKMYQFH